MKKILGLTLVLVLSVYSAALACNDHAKGTSASAAAAGECSSHAKGAMAASAGECSMHSKGASAASAGECSAHAKGAMAASAGECPYSKGAAAASAGECAGHSKASAASSKMAGECNMSSAECQKMEHTKFSVAGLNNKAAAVKVRTALAGVSNVHDVSCDLKSCTATVCWKGAKATDAVATKLTAAGYRTTVVGATSCPYAKSSAAGKACPHDMNQKASAAKDNSKAS